MENIVDLNDQSVSYKPRSNLKTAENQVMHISKVETLESPRYGQYVVLTTSDGAEYFSFCTPILQITEHIQKLLNGYKIVRAKVSVTGNTCFLEKPPKEIKLEDKQ